MILNIIFLVSVSANYTDFRDCKLSHLGLDYFGDVSRTESNIRCQSWSSNDPHKVDPGLKGESFVDGSLEKAENFCRNPNRDPEGPWCYTLSLDLINETCGIPLCSFPVCRITGPGMEYSGNISKSSTDRTCLKWDKNRHEINYEGSLKSLPKFSPIKFPENDLSTVRNFCRNPDGDIRGPWCLTENPETDLIQKEYCEVPFCPDKDCVFLSKPTKLYSHYISLPETKNFTFGIKLWNPDNTSPEATIALTLLPLPSEPSHLEPLSIGIEIYISKNQTSLRYGNKDLEYHTITKAMKGFEFTMYTVSWHKGSLQFSHSDGKEIFLAEFETTNNLLEAKPDQFAFYSAKGTNILWTFPFCLQETCEIHTTTSKLFQKFYPLKHKENQRELDFQLRAFHSAQIVLVPSPSLAYPRIKLVLQDLNSFTRALYKDHEHSAYKLLKEVQISDLLNYWEWREFSISVFRGTVQLYAKKQNGVHLILDVFLEELKQVMWFSVSSDSSMGHWSFFCEPSVRWKAPEAVVPECALLETEADYIGTQSVTSKGFGCIPWISKWVPEGFFEKGEKMLEAWNYCRDPKKELNGTFCFALTFNSTKTQVEKKFCKLRKCKSEECKIAGTGNDYIGPINRTRSNRTCLYWSNSTIKWNDTLFSDTSREKAKNYCRNPSRDISGTWCYISETSYETESCSIPDCDLSESCTILIQSSYDRKIFILPEWKQPGLHGGLHFSIKQWNPDILDGIIFTITPNSSHPKTKLLIGAERNEKLFLYHNNILIQQNHMPHLISSGRWTSFWLQLRKGELILGFKGIPTYLIEWKAEQEAFEPVFIEFSSIYNSPLGLHFNCNQCHTEMTTTSSLKKYYPITLWENSNENILNLTLRGKGTVTIALYNLPQSQTYVLIKLNPLKNSISLMKRTKGITNTLSTKDSVQSIISESSWSYISLHFTEHYLAVLSGDKTIFSFKSDEALIIYWFSIGVKRGWIVWSANCKPVDLDGPPRDGGWTAWSPWACSVSCGGGEGYKTRSCTNPVPNIFGRECSGPARVSGPCNEFPCGDLSPKTIELARKELQRTDFSFLVNETDPVLIPNDQQLIKLILTESPEAYYEWTLNGIPIRANERVSIKNHDLAIRNTEVSDTGVYVCLLYKIDRKRLVVRVVSLSVIPKTVNVVTRIGRSVTVHCNSIALGYVYSDLSLKILVNGRIFINHGLTTLAAVDAFQIKSVYENLSGDVTCLVEQKDLDFKWITNYLKIEVMEKANLLTYLREDKLTRSVFGWVRTDLGVVVLLILIGGGVTGFVILVVFLYFKFCTLDTTRPYVKNRRKG